jgi:SAM-dependent methyltransferase
VRYVARRPLLPWIAREPETVVRIPPLDDSSVAAIKLIAPQYSDLTTDEASRRFWERDQNGSCWTEDAALSDLFGAMPPVRRVLEIGPGVGRSAAFFSRRWFPDAHFDLYDATGSSTKYELNGPRYDDSFCGNLDLLRRVVEYNGVKNYRILDASTTNGRLPVPDHPYDLIYSFWAIGFHWSLDHWIEEILATAHDQTLCVFTVPSRYEPSPRIAAMPHLLIDSAPCLRTSPTSTTYYLALLRRPASWFPAS